MAGLRKTDRQYAPTSHIFAAMVIATAACPSSARAESPPKIETVRAAFGDARERAGPVRIEIEWHLGLDSFDDPLGREHLVFEFKNSGEKVYTHTLDGTRAEFAYFNGAITKYYFPSGPRGPEGRISQIRPSLMSPNTLPWWANIWEKPLLYRFEDDALSVVAEPVSRDGHELWVVQGICAEHAEHLHYRLYIDETIGWMPRIIEFVLVKDSNVRVHQAKRLMDYRQFDGVWIPMRLEQEGFLESGETHRNVFIMSDIEVNAVLPDDAFVFEFPAGTKIRDESSGRTFIQP